MSKASLFGIVMIYMALALFLYLGGVRVVAEDTSGYLDNFINIDDYENGTLSVDSEFEGSVPKSYTESGGGGLLSFIDVLGSIRSFLIFLVNLIFSPLGLFIGSGIPINIAVMMGLPLLISGVFGLIYLIRGIA